MPHSPTPTEIGGYLEARLDCCTDPNSMGTDCW